MHRAATLLAALTAGAAITLGTAAPALAARGTLTVSGNRYDNPAKGCYTGKFWPLAVNNQTNTPVSVYGGEDCRGHSLGTVAPGRSRMFEFGRSVYVPR